MHRRDSNYKGSVTFLLENLKVSQLGRTRHGFRTKELISVFEVVENKIETRSFVVTVISRLNDGEFFNLLSSK